MRTRLYKLTLISLSLAFGLVLASDAPVISSPSSDLPERPSPSSPTEIREYDPLPSQLMRVTYANERVFLFRVKEVNPRSDCNQIQYDIASREIKIITQAMSNAYEYILHPDPLMYSDWVMFEK
jgi:hypothetical protein